MSNIKKNLSFGSRQAVRSCVKLKPDEKVVIITDLATEKIARALEKEVEEISPNNCQVFLMEDFGQRSPDGQNPLLLPKKIASALKMAQVSFFAARKIKGELATFRKPLRNIVLECKVRHAHMVDINEELMCTGMCADYTEIQRVSQKVYEYVEKARTLQIISPRGTNLTVDLGEKYKWVISDGNISADKPGNLPSGEIYTHPETANGVYVIDGVLGDYFSSKYGLLDDNPLEVTVKEGVVTKLNCSLKSLEEEFAQYLKIDENAKRIGELGIGTNVFIEELLGVMLQDEKYPGVHIAVGSGYPDQTGCEYTSNAHCDGVIKNTSIQVDGRWLMRDGKFVFE